MIKTIEIDRNLFFLLVLLFSIDNFEFDEDISNLLSELKDLIDKKLFSTIYNEDRDIKNSKLFLKFYLK